MEQQQGHEQYNEQQHDVPLENRDKPTTTPSTLSIAPPASIPKPGAPPADIYGANDEIEFLLDEIKDLEAPACSHADEQEFEIAGSRADLDLSLQLDSPIESSWFVFPLTYTHPTIT